MKSARVKRASSAVYYVGPSGWSYPDWAGIVYPHRASSRFDGLAYLAKYFNAVEVNVSFYRAVTARMSSSWVRRVSEHQGFRFAFKLQQSFTHQRTRYTKEAVETYLEGVRPVAEASRLGCLLMQFPWSFRRSAEAIDWLRRLVGDFGEFPLVVELRHDSWGVPETIALLGELGVGYCNIDQPRLGHCLGPTGHATSKVSYVRFHGRRADNWFAQNIATHERYNYLYTEEELREWVPRIQEIGAQADDVFVFANNHYRGQGAANALQLRSLLEGGQVDVPPVLLQAFPALMEVRKASEESFPETLF